MSVGLLIITHRQLGADILATARDIFNGLPASVEVLSVEPDSHYENTLQLAKQHISKLDNGDGVLILTDIFGATPCNIAVKAARQQNVRIIAGINLPMVIRVLNYASSPLEVVVSKAINAGHASIFECSQS